MTELLAWGGLVAGAVLLALGTRMEARQRDRDG